MHCVFQHNNVQRMSPGCPIRTLPWRHRYLYDPGTWHRVRMRTWSYTRWPVASCLQCAGQRRSLRKELRMIRIAAEIWIWKYNREIHIINNCIHVHVLTSSDTHARLFRFKYYIRRWAESNGLDWTWVFHDGVLESALMSRACCKNYCYLVHEIRKLQ